MPPENQGITNVPVKPRFDGTIQLGHLVQGVILFVTGIVGVVAIYYGMMQTNYAQDARLDALSARITSEVKRVDDRLTSEVLRIESRVNNGEKAFDRSQSEEKEQLNGIRLSVERVQSSVGQINIEVARFIGGQNAHK